MTVFIPYFPLLLAIIGLIVYALATTAKPAEVGRILFWVGLLAWLVRCPMSPGR